MAASRLTRRVRREWPRPRTRRMRNSSKGATASCETGASRGTASSVGHSMAGAATRGFYHGMHVPGGLLRNKTSPEQGVVEFAMAIIESRPSGVRISTRAMSSAASSSPWSTLCGPALLDVRSRRRLCRLRPRADVPAEQVAVRGTLLPLGRLSRQEWVGGGAELMGYHPGCPFLPVPPRVTRWLQLTQPDHNQTASLLLNPQHLENLSGGQN